MAVILKIDGEEVKIGTDDGKVVTVPLKSVNYKKEGMSKGCAVE